MSRALIVPLCLLFAAVLAGPAAAQTPAPDCHGVNVTDKEGDSANAVSGQAGSPSSDLVAGFVTYDPATNKAQANIQVANLTEGEIDAPYVAIGWEMGFKTTAGARFVRAYQDRTGIVKYTWGEPRAVTDDQTTPRAGGDTTGKLFPGPKGVIQIDIPLDDVGAKPGSELKVFTLEVRQWASLPAAVPTIPAPLYSPAPVYDDAGGKGVYVLADCPQAPAPGAPGGPPAPEPTPAPGGQVARLEVKVTVPKLRAKKLAKTRKIKLKLGGHASAIKAQLRAGVGPDAKVLGRGKLATLDGSGKLTLRLRGKVKRGRYVLALTGRNADGAAAEGAVGVRVR